MMYLVRREWDEFAFLSGWVCGKNAPDWNNNNRKAAARRREYLGAVGWIFIFFAFCGPRSYATVKTSENSWKEEWFYGRHPIDASLKCGSKNLAQPSTLDHRQFDSTAVQVSPYLPLLPQPNSCQECHRACVDETIEGTTRVKTKNTYPQEQLTKYSFAIAVDSHVEFAISVFVCKSKYNNIAPFAVSRFKLEINWLT